MFAPVQLSLLDADQMNFTSGADVSELLSLDRIRGQLIRLEDTIIFCPLFPLHGLLATDAKLQP